MAKKFHLWIANHRCQLCNKTGNLYVHHRFYGRAGHERFELFGEAQNLVDNPEAIEIKKQRLRGKVAYIRYLPLKKMYLK